LHFLFANHELTQNRQVISDKLKAVGASRHQINDLHQRNQEYVAPITFANPVGYLLEAAQLSLRLHLRQHLDRDRVLNECHQYEAQHHSIHSVVALTHFISSEIDNDEGGSERHSEKEDEGLLAIKTHQLGLIYLRLLGLWLG